MSSPGVSAELSNAAPGPAVSAKVQNLRAAGSIAIVVLGLLLFWPTTASLIEHWEDTVRRTYTHGYLVVVITLYLLWRSRGLWADVKIGPNLLALAAVLVASIGWLIAFRAGLQIVHQVLLPAIIFGAFMSCYGFTAARRLSLSFGYLYFAVPIWDTFNPLLQSASVVAVKFLLRVVGIPVFFSGNTFTMPAGSLEIADGCSGLHFFVVGLAIAVLYGELNRDSLWTRTKLVVLAGFLAVLTNWVRIFIIAVAGHLTDMQHYLVRQEHYSFGWIMFVGTMAIFFLIVRRWPAPAEASAPVATEASSNGGALSVPGAVFALICLLFAPIWYRVDSNRVAVEDLPRLLPEQIAGWSSEPTARDEWQPVFNGADASQRVTFTRAADSIAGYAALYTEQRQGKELIGYDNSLVGEYVRVRRQGRADAPWLEIEAVDAHGVSWLLWYSYRLDEQWHDRALPLQVDYGIESLTGAPLSAVIAFRTACQGEDCSGARTTLRELVTAAWPKDQQ